MSKRFKIDQVSPEATPAIRKIEAYLATVPLSKQQKELIKIRASQINGCAYCVDMHLNIARSTGETQQRLDLICVWREAGEIFTEEEQLLLSMAEEITLIHQNGLSDATYRKAIDLIGEEKTAAVIMTVIAINAWNRLVISLHTPVGDKVL